jgi:hypothetical protein
VAADGGLITRLRRSGWSAASPPGHAAGRNGVGYRMRVTILQTIGVFVGIPALIYGTIAVLTMVPGRHKRPRYRPGQAWDYPSQWWAGDQPVVTAAGGENRLAQGGGAHGTW